MKKESFRNIVNTLNFFKKNTIPVVYSCNDKHAVLALVSMTSIAENTDSCVEFFILYSNLSDKSLNMLNSLSSKYKNCKVNFKKIDEARFKDFKNVSWVTVEGWYRVLIPELLKNYKKALYLDCDTLALGDIAELYNKDISNVLAGVVKDVWGINDACKRTNLCDKSYFNSGVMLINCEKWRKTDFYNKVEDYVLNNDYKYGDQDVLNYLISSDKKMLSTRYNYLEGWFGNYRNDYEANEIEDYENAKNHPLIIHFTAYKPDTPDSHHSMKEKWWEYARKTVWYDIKKEKEALKEIYFKPPLNYHGSIPVCYLVNEKDAPYALTSLVSVLENTKNNIDTLIVDLGLKEETKKKFTSIKYDNCNLKFIKIENDKIPNGFPVLDYFIFKINEFTNFKKVIYLANHTLLNGDIQELYNYDISNVLMASVQDVWNKASSQKINLGNENYFSCGVMLLNVENFKKANLLNCALEYHKNNPKLSEQDILNKIINDDKILISPRYNYMEPWWHNYYNEYKYNFLREYEKAKKNPLIIHFTGYLPDDIRNLHSFKELWWRYLKKTDYCIEKLEEFRLNFYPEKSNFDRKISNYKNKFKKINDEISN